jgi:hypothetical protein
VYLFVLDGKKLRSGSGSGFSAYIILLDIFVKEKTVPKRSDPVLWLAMFDLRILLLSGSGSDFRFENYFCLSSNCQFLIRENFISWQYVFKTLWAVHGSGSGSGVPAFEENPTPLVARNA